MQRVIIFKATKTSITQQTWLLDPLCSKSELKFFQNIVFWWFFYLCYLCSFFSDNHQWRGQNRRTLEVGFLPSHWVNFSTQTVTGWCVLCLLPILYVVSQRRRLKSSKSKKFLFDIYTSLCMSKRRDHTLFIFCNVDILKTAFF